jgi:hypothetical protein
MELKEDSIYASPAPRVGSNSAEQRRLPRTHTRQAYHKAMEALKTKGKNLGRGLPPRPRQAVTGSMAKPEWIVRHMGGKCPPFNSNSNWLHDPSNRRIYTYGGLSPGDHSQIPTSEFYICDTTTMEWKDMTVSILCLLMLSAHRP